MILRKLEPGEKVAAGGTITFVSDCCQAVVQVTGSAATGKTCTRCENPCEGVTYEVIDRDGKSDCCGRAALVLCWTTRYWTCGTCGRPCDVTVS